MEKLSGSGNNRPLEQIQNALFVTREPNKCLENESANHTAAQQEATELAKSRASATTTSTASEAASSPCHRRRRSQCKKLVRRFKKVLKFTNKDRVTEQKEQQQQEEQEDIYVEVSTPTISRSGHGSRDMEDLILIGTLGEC